MKSARKNPADQVRHAAGKLEDGSLSPEAAAVILETIASEMDVILKSPVRVDIQYDDQGPELFCDRQSYRKIITGKVWRERCYASLRAGAVGDPHTVGEIWESLQEHLALDQHLPPEY